MARSNSPEALHKLGFNLNTVKQWREKELDEGRPSGFDDFLLAHGICVRCGGHGTLVLGVRWRDDEGREQLERGPIASLVQQHGLDDPKHWLNDTLKWDCLYEACESCNGLGKADSSPHSTRDSGPANSAFPSGVLEEITTPKSG